MPVGTVSHRLIRNAQAWFAIDLGVFHVKQCCFALCGRGICWLSAGVEGGVYERRFCRTAGELQDNARGGGKRRRGPGGRVLASYIQVR